MIRRLLYAFRVLAALGLLGLPALGHAAPAQWSIDRASFGVDAKAAITEHAGAKSSAFLPGAYLSYSLTSQLSAAATYERDFARGLSLGRAGFRMAVARVGDEGRVWGGVNVVGYGDEGAAGIAKPTSWEAVAQASYPLVWASNGQTAVWGIAGASHDPDNSLTTYRIGLRYQAVGGKRL